MIQKITQDYRPIVYAPSSLEASLDRLENVCLRIGCDLRPTLRLENLRSGISSSENSVVVIPTELSFAAILPTIHTLQLHSNPIEVILLTYGWKAFDAVRAIRLGMTDVLDLPIDEALLQQSIEEALLRDAKRKVARSFGIPMILTERLTFQESRILAAISQGKTTKQIGSELDLSVRTVHYRFKSIVTKLGVTSRAEAVELLCRYTATAAAEETLYSNVR
ncbi:response regulator FixJ [Pirellula sp. SH-Sr6A]|uniref:LuxR C-terminal-related transcriptional regulator n=1 Tax=Pirellula sp. SH-Sr6A TaxID=1632865 RepID=UPI00078C94A6|nr:LuxR C-terminal-related transcriptional regulator [Pirellula sp. SH-Sr6A]AMV31072.1 response regulator FixJ [Pirellula sp. SH-Sr6A]